MSVLHKGQIIWAFTVNLKQVAMQPDSLRLSLTPNSSFTSEESITLADFMKVSSTVMTIGSLWMMNKT